jgi:hypothetical protein
MAPSQSQSRAHLREQIEHAAAGRLACAAHGRNGDTADLLWHRRTADALIAYLPQARERWLVRLRPWILRAVQSQARGDWQRQHSCAYVCVSWRCKRFYIGKTDRLLSERTREHLIATLTDESARANALRAHEWMSRFGAHAYVILPLAFVPAGEAREAERRLIKELTPQLNVHTPLAVAAMRRHGFRLATARRRHRPWIHSRRAAERASTDTSPRRRRKRRSGRMLAMSTATLLPAGPVVGNLATVFRSWVPLSGSGRDGVDQKIVNQNMRWDPGGLSYTDFSALRLAYGKSVIRVNGQLTDLGKFVSALRRSRRPLEFEVIIARLTPPPLLLGKRDLCILLRQPGQITAFYQYPLTRFVHLLRAVRLFSNKATRRTLRGRLYALVRRLFGVNLKARPLLRVPYHNTLQRYELRAILNRAINDIPLCAAAQDYLRMRAKVVYTQRPSVAKVLHNFRKFVKNFALTCPSSCDCGRTRGLPKINGHVHARTSDLSDTEWDVLAQNSANIPTPDAVDVARELREAEARFRSSLFDVGDSADFNVFLDNGGGGSFPRAATSPPTPPAACVARGAAVGSLASVRAATQALGDLVRTPLDKNPGDTWIECPIATWHRYYNFYFLQPKVYRRPAETEEEAKRAMRKDYKDMGLERVAKYDTTGSFGRAQLLPKHKAPIEKARPVTPMHKACTRRSSNYAARALNALVERRYRARDWVLWRTFDLKAKMAAATERLRALGPDFRAIGASFDATGMFTNLPHTGDGGSYAFLDDMAAWCRANNITELSVRKRGRAGVVFGRVESAGAYKTISIDDVFAVLRYDIKWLFFMLGDTMLAQLFGFPMGMPSSHPLSVGMCAWSEDRYAFTLGMDERMLSVTRYVDDVQILIFYNFITSSVTAARARLEHFRANAYDANLSLLATFDDEHNVDFMDTIVRVDDTTQEIYIDQMDKNTRHLVAGRKRVIVRYQHYHSFVPATLLHGVAMSQMLRLERNTTREADLLMRGLAYALELRALQYPVRVVRQAVRSCQRRSPLVAAWPRLASLLTTVAETHWGVTLTSP